MISYNSLETHELVNNILIGLTLGNSCEIIKENNIAKIKIKSNISNKNFIKFIYNLIKNINEIFILNDLKISDDFIYFILVDNELAKFIILNFYMNDSFDLMYTDESSLSFIKNFKKYKTSWGSIVYDTLDERYSTTYFKKYISKRLYKDPLIFNGCSLIFWYMDMGFYDWESGRYCLDVSNLEKSYLIIILTIFKKRLKIKWIYSKIKKLIILSKKSEYFFEILLQLYLIPDLSWKAKNYWSYDSFHQYGIIFLLLMNYHQVKNISV